MGRPQPLQAANDSWVARAIVLARSSGLGHSVHSDIYSSSTKTGSIVSTGAMYRRTVVDIVGWVDECFDACEDLEFNYRIEQAGLSTHFEPRLAVTYLSRSTLRSLFRQMFRYGLGRHRFVRKHPRALTLETLVPAALVLAIASTPLSLAVSHPLGRVLPIASLLYALIVVIASTILALRAKDTITILILPLVFATLHFGLGCGFLRGIFVRRQ